MRTVDEDEAGREYIHYAMNRKRNTPLHGNGISKYTGADSHLAPKGQSHGELPCGFVPQ
jgi:hypothetical protein